MNKPIPTHDSRRTLVALMEDKPGSLSHVANLFRRRNYNIESLWWATARPPDHAHDRGGFGDDAVVEQMTKQLYKLITSPR